MEAREAFYNHYASLVNILGYDVENLLPELIAQRVLTLNDKVVIEKTVNPSEKAGRLLNFISGPLDAGNQATFEKLLQIMVNGDNQATRDTALQIMKEAGITPPRTPPNNRASTAITGTIYTYYSQCISHPIVCTQLICLCRYSITRGQHYTTICTPMRW